MQRFLIKNIVELEFASNLGELEEHLLFYTALKKLFTGIELNLKEQNSLGNIIYRQYYDPTVCVRENTLTKIDEKEASLLFRAHLLICLIHQFNQQDDVSQKLYDLNWFKQQRAQLVNEAKTYLPFRFSLGNSIGQSPTFYIRCVLVISALIAFSPLLFRSTAEKTFEELGLPADGLMNYLSIVFLLCLASVASLSQVPSYYRQSNTFFKEQKSVETNFHSIIAELNNLIEQNDNNSYFSLRGE
ncbi:hypothetical protein [Legionella beliardensis]|nr:hypothetical protein [Legionella beliardensis]